MTIALYRQWQKEKPVFDSTNPDGPMLPLNSISELKRGWVAFRNIRTDELVSSPWDTGCHNPDQFRQPCQRMAASTQSLGGTMPHVHRMTRAQLARARTRGTVSLMT